LVKDLRSLDVRLLQVPDLLPGEKINTGEKEKRMNSLINSLTGDLTFILFEINL